MENALYDFYSLVVSYQKTHSFAALNRSFSDTTQLVNKNRTRAFSVKWSLLTDQLQLVQNGTISQSEVKVTRTLLKARENVRARSSYDWFSFSLVEKKARDWA